MLEPDLQSGKIFGCIQVYYFALQLFVLIMSLWLYLCILFVIFNYFMHFLSFYLCTILHNHVFSRGDGLHVLIRFERHTPQKRNPLVGVLGPFLPFLLVPACHGSHTLFFISVVSAFLFPGNSHIFCCFLSFKHSTIGHFLFKYLSFV
jgi:hypothetical protein